MRNTIAGIVTWFYSLYMPPLCTAGDGLAVGNHNVLRPGKEANCAVRLSILYSEL